MRKPALAALALLLAACATKPEEPPAVVAPPEPEPFVLKLDDADVAILDGLLQTAAALPPGKVQPWENPATGKTGSLTLIRQGYTREGRRCGEMHLDARQHGYRAQDVRLACLDPDGRWRPEGGFAVAG